MPDTTQVFTVRVDANPTTIRRTGLAACVLLCEVLAGCATLGYYTELARGQIDLLSRREPITEVIADPGRDAELRRRLRLVLEARRFAVDHLRLPDNASYTLYADLQRSYAVWNVLATPEFSLEPLQSCFPIAGCIAYRGHYRRERAEAQADALRARGHDVAISGVSAYSTLGWFDDPVLNTMLHWSDAVLVGTVFHELAHQRLYLRDDTAFNESMASFVEQQGLQEFFASGGLPAHQDAAERRRRQQFVGLLLAARSKLDALYGQPLAEVEMRARKAAVFAQTKRDYAELRDGQWQGAADYDSWFERDLNNAHLLGVGLYDARVPAFAALYDRCGRDWTAFHSAVAALAAEPPSRRREHLQALMDPAAAKAEH